MAAVDALQDPLAERCLQMEMLAVKCARQAALSESKGFDTDVLATGVLIVHFQGLNLLAASCCSERSLPASQQRAWS